MKKSVSPGMQVRTGLSAGEVLTVYGSQDCSWTRKQIEYLKQKGFPYTFVDCDNQDCPEFVEAFPTITKGGQVYVGFTQF